ncbi:MAG: DUF975 family protein [Lachnospiraceae bacterium]|nr:DUF975 family protein [Lachnospiraceae bacterium]
MWTIGELKQRGKETFKLNYWKCVAVAFIFSIIAGGVSAPSFSYPARYNNDNVIEEADENVEEKDEAGTEDDKDAALKKAEDEFEFHFDPINGFTGNKEAAVAFVIFMVIFVLVISVIVTVIVFAIKALWTNPFEIGLNRFFVNNLTEPARVSDIAHGFDTSYKNIVKVMFFKDLYLFLWCLIPIAGVFIAIVKSYEYKMIPYLLADDPDMDREEAFARSKEMMDGNKWHAFVLGLSFLGWHLLSVFTLGILEVFYVLPYLYSTYAALYENLSSGYTVDTGAAGEIYIEEKADHDNGDPITDEA